MKKRSRAQKRMLRRAAAHAARGWHYTFTYAWVPDTRDDSGRGRAAHSIGAGELRTAKSLERRGYVTLDYEKHGPQNTAVHVRLVL